MSSDEFAMLAENAADANLLWVDQAQVARHETLVSDDRHVSAIVWGDQPEVVFLHGGGQNAHTWDTVVMAMGIAALAVDLAGHGHSDPAPGKPVIYDPVALADDTAIVWRSLAPRARAVVGMSLGGLVAIVLASRHRELVEHLAVIDVTPGVTQAKAATMGPPRGAAPESFATLEEIVERTVAADPSRARSSLRRGVIHNTKQLPNGRWVWRYDRLPRDQEGHALDSDGNRVEPGLPMELPGGRDIDPNEPLYPALWDDISAIDAPLLLVLGSRSGVVGADDLAQLQQRQPEARIETVDDAGHRVQGDKPVELAGLLADFLGGHP